MKNRLSALGGIRRDLVCLDDGDLVVLSSPGLDARHPEVPVDELRSHLAEAALEFRDRAVARVEEIAAAHPSPAGLTPCIAMGFDLGLTDDAGTRLVYPLRVSFGRFEISGRETWVAHCELDGEDYWNPRMQLPPHMN
jgi:hypothetical protein